MNCEITFCELREKEVINMCDGKSLGRVIDLALTFNGHVIGIIVPGDKCIFKNITNNNSIFIPWQNICKIGDDVILVNLINKMLP
jgi:YlmC/YmxH family sporulation protein